MRSMPFVAVPLLLLCGCAGQTQDFPSLAPRAVESRPETPAAAEPAPTPAADPALAGRIAALVDRAKAGDAAFAAALPAASAAADGARGTAPGDERWITAQQQLSALEAARGAAMTLLAELDTLYLARLDAVGRGESPAGLGEIRDARDAAERSAADQQAQIDSIRARLPR